VLPVLVAAMLSTMPRVLSLVTFSIEASHRAEFLKRAVEELRPYWHAHGVERYDVYEEMGPSGPTGRLVEVYVLPDAEAYQRMTQHVRTAQDLPNRAYRLVREPQFQVLELRT
jgi:quinol monooxygenase YgiN